jgi:hypothetical protein
LSGRVQPGPAQESRPGPIAKMHTIDWTQIAITAITTLGTVLSGLFAARSRRHAGQAAESADRAVEASLRPGRELVTDPPPSV